jgi:phospholipase C
MKKAWLFKIGILIALVLCSCTPSVPGFTPTSFNTPTSMPSYTLTPAANAANPCFGAATPVQWHHVVVLMFENKTYDQIIGAAPYITSLAQKCATAPQWHDADFRVDGTSDGIYHSKPSYATLTNGVSPSVHGLITDHYREQTNVDNIYHQLSKAGLTFKDYYDGDPGGCDVYFDGKYHDPIRYYTDVADICSKHDVPLSTFMADVNSGNLPAFSMVLPNNQHNTHDNNILSGDAYAQSLLDPLLNSQIYANGDLAIFLLWDEDTPIPNVILAPSIVPGTKITVQTGNPISHFSALRTWEDMLDLPLLGDTNAAPSLLPYLGG